MNDDRIGHCLNTHEVSGKTKEKPFNYDLDRMKEKVEDVEMNNEWYEKGELPPKGLDVEARFIDGGEWRSWQKGFFKAGFESKLWFKYAHAEIVSPAHEVEFRPIQSKRDKLIEEALELIEKHKNDKGLVMTQSLAKSIVDAGWRPKR